MFYKLNQMYLLKLHLLNLLIFEPIVDSETLRELVNRAVSLAGGAVVALSGSDAEGYRYVIGSRSLPLRALSREYNAALGGRGGGSDAMVQGSFSASESDIFPFTKARRVKSPGPAGSAPAANAALSTARVTAVPP